MIHEWRALETMSELDIQPTESEERRHFGCLVIQPTIIKRILEAQKNDEGLQVWFTRMSAKEPTKWSIGLDGRFRCRNRLCVPDVDGLRQDILDEAHKSHLGGTKMYKDLKQNFWWDGMKLLVTFFKI